MAVTYPFFHLFYDYKIKVDSFGLNYRQAYSRTMNGASTVVDQREPVWTASFTSAVMTEDDCLTLQAELEMLQGSVQAFVARDTRRPFPAKGPQSYAYETAVITSVGASRGEVNISGMPPGLVLTPGDRFSVVAFGNRRLLFQIGEAATVSGAGSVGPISISPFLPAAVSLPVSAKFAEPGCTMRLTPNSISYNRADNLLATVSFAAEQLL